jgi:phosphohistidine phosphatase
MQLLLVRHAIAFEPNGRRWPDDAERPLSPQGTERARKAALGLEHLVQRPGRVLASPLLRTQQTAAILTRFAGWPPAVACPQLMPGASAEELLAVLARTRHACMAVIGHEPGLSRLIAACLPGSLGAHACEMKKMGVALLGFAGAPRAGRGRLEGLLPPRSLRAAR